MISIRVTRECFREDRKKVADAGLVGLVDAEEWAASSPEVRVLLEGRKNRAVLPRDALHPVLFGLWSPRDRGFLMDGDAVASFTDPHDAMQMAADTDFVVAEILDGAWSPPSTWDGTVPASAAALLALVVPG